MNILRRIIDWVLERTIGRVYEPTGEFTGVYEMYPDDHIILAYDMARPNQSPAICYREYGTPNILHIVEVKD